MDYIILSFWAILVLIVFVQYAPLCKDLPFENKFAVFIVLVFCAPIIVLDSIVQGLLDCFLPEGWDSQ